jgi:hypothetical protein
MSSVPFLVWDTLSIKVIRALAGCRDAAAHASLHRAGERRTVMINAACISGDREILSNEPQILDL